MRAVVFYKSNSEHGRVVEDYLRDFHMQTGKTLETLDPETREGVSLCGLYDILQFPTIVATDDSGNLLQTWVGEPLPRINEVSYYVES